MGPQVPWYTSTTAREKKTIVKHKNTIIVTTKSNWATPSKQLSSSFHIGRMNELCTPHCCKPHACFFAPDNHANAIKTVVFGELGLKLGSKDC